jgi:hypothetical protein
LPFTIDEHQLKYSSDLKIFSFEIEFKRSLKNNGSSSGCAKREIKKVNCNRSKGNIFITIEKEVY